MKIKHTLLRRILQVAPTLLALLIPLALAMPAAAESAADLLEKGIYTEETVGDLTAAIKIYTQVLEDAKAKRPHIAQAQFRLGMCHLKKGSDAEARAVFETLIRDFPEQKGLVAESRKQLKAVQPGLALQSAPWEDGEYLGYRMSLPAGKVLGSLHLMAESAVVDGVDAWRLELRRFASNHANNYGVSRVWVDRQTQRPIRSSIRHGFFGNADAVFGLDGVEISNGETTSQLETASEVFDNDQTVHLMRTLPLELGYKTKINLLPIWTGQIIEIDLEVKGKETCRVPAGDFDCYKVKTSNGETYWISTGAERYPLKLKTSGVIIELASIGRADSTAPVGFGLEDFGFSGTLPAGWLFHSFRLREDRAMIRLLGPDAGTISAVELDRCPSRGCPSLKHAEKELAGAKRRFKDFELREGSWTDRTIGGEPAVSFIGDYLRDGKPWVQYRLYTFFNDVRLELIFRTSLERFEELRPAFDSIVEHLQAE